MYDRTVVILLSDKRSGSTLFQRELIKHSLVRTVDYSPHTFLETHHWLKAAVLMEQVGASGSVYKNYGGRSGARTYMQDTIKGNVPEFELPSSDQELITQGWEALCQQFAQPVFFEKSPQVLSKRPALEQMLHWARHTKYKLRVIGLVRNPMAVQYSAFELFHTQPSKRQFSWARTQGNLLWVEKQLGDEQFMRIRYEDLTADPQEVFRQVCSFIGIPYEEGMGADAHQESLKRWVDDPLFTLQLDPLVSQLAVEFGYGPDDLFNPKKPRPGMAIRLRQWLRRNASRLSSRVFNRWIHPIYLRLKKRA